MEALAAGLGAIGLCVGIGSLAWALAERRRYSSPFLHKYPIGHPASPIPDLAGVEKRAGTIFRAGVSDIPGVDLNTEAQLALLDSLSVYRKDMPAWDRPAESCRYTFDNYFFTGTDAILLYSLLRHYRPGRVVEVGSGFSSAVMLDTREAFPEIGTEFTFIEPNPARLNSLLKEGDRKRCTIIEKSLQDVGLSPFADLGRNDMVFVDTAHQMKIGSEVLHLLFEILPRLKPGVLVHFHDIFWPFEYPREWVEVGRSWNESYGLRAFLQYSDSFEVAFWASYLGNVHRAAMKQKMPYGKDDLVGNTDAGGNFNAGGSLWLRKKK